MDMKELFKVIIACVLLSNTLTILGAEQWLATLCCFGMSFFWIPPQTTTR